MSVTFRKKARGEHSAVSKELAFPLSRILDSSGSLFASIVYMTFFFFWVFIVRLDSCCSCVYKENPGKQFHFLSTKVLTQPKQNWLLSLLCSQSGKQVLERKGKTPYCLNRSTGTLTHPDVYVPKSWVDKTCRVDGLRVELREGLGWTWLREELWSCCLSLLVSRGRCPIDTQSQESVGS